MNDVLEFPPLADVDTPPAVPAHALTTIAAVAASLCLPVEAVREVVDEGEPA